jgi:hypothetical protein
MTLDMDPAYRTEMTMELDSRWDWIDGAFGESDPESHVIRTR